VLLIAGAATCKLRGGSEGAVRVLPQGGRHARCEGGRVCFSDAHGVVAGCVCVVRARVAGFWYIRHSIQHTPICSYI